MAKDLFATLDLNLLRIFYVIFQERSLTRTAERLYVTQPAVSKSLAKLRHHFDDKLFIRSYHGLLPTEFAENLYKNLGPAMNSVSDAINANVEFDPLALEGQLRISLSPFLFHAIGSDLYENIHIEAPNVQLILLNWSSKTLVNIHNKEIDIGVNYEFNNSYKDVVSELLGEDEFSIYVRPDHPFSADSITAEELSKHELVTIITADWNFNESIVAKELKNRGFPAKVSLRSELPTVLVNTLLNSDAMLPSSRFLSHNKSLNLRKITFSDNVAMEVIPVVGYFHKQAKETNKNRWLFNHIKALVK